MSTDVRATGKSRSQRINIDYYKHKTGLTKSRAWLALIALLLALGYCGYVFSVGSGSHISTGPVASAHAAFENDCRQCHFDFSPISGDALRLVSAKSLEHHEEACQKCHRVDPHFRTGMTPEFARVDQHCSGCHTDHLGRDNDMVNVASGKCVQCHGNLPATCVSPDSLTIKPQVTAFTASAHGNFASLSQGDPGRIKFDHAQHMLPGQVDLNTKGGFTLAMLPPEMREAYRKSPSGSPQTDDSLVTLACTDCHQYAGVPEDSRRPGTEQVGDSELGRHLTVVSFEKHCLACHAMPTIGQDKDSLSLPHAAPWKDIDNLIAARITGGQLPGDIRKPREVIRVVPLVGEGEEGALPIEDDAKADSGSSTRSQPSAYGDAVLSDRLALQAAIQAGRARAEATCLKCHEPEDVTEASIIAHRRDEVASLIPSRWLKRGLYDHATHRKVSCAFCHSQAYPVEGKPSPDLQAGGPSDSDVVMIGGIETCEGCHRPAETPTPASLLDNGIVSMLGGQSTWASDSCVECHRYHWAPPRPGQTDEPVPPTTTQPQVALGGVPLP